LNSGPENTKKLKLKDIYIERERPTFLHNLVVSYENIEKEEKDFFA
jgi:hypothetical protein